MVGLATRLIDRTMHPYRLCVPESALLPGGKRLLPSRHANLPPCWRSHHVAPWEVMHKYPTCWVTFPRPEFWPHGISEKIIPKDYSCFHQFVPMQTQYRTCMPGEQTPCRTGHSRTRGQIRDLGLPEQLREGCLSSCFGSLWRAAQSQLLTSAEGSIGWGLLRFTVKVRGALMNGNFLSPWPCTWFSPFANYQMKHGNKSS